MRPLTMMSSTLACGRSLTSVCKALTMSAPMAAWTSVTVSDGKHRQTTLGCSSGILPCPKLLSARFAPSRYHHMQGAVRLS